MSDEEEKEPWDVEISKRAKKDILWHIEDGRYINKVFEILETIADNPFERSQDYKALKGKLKGSHERRINDQFRVIYSVDKVVRIVCVVSAKDHT